MQRRFTKMNTNDGSLSEQPGRAAGSAPLRPCCSRPRFGEYPTEFRHPSSSEVGAGDDASRLQLVQEGNAAKLIFPNESRPCCDLGPAWRAAAGKLPYFVRSSLSALEFLLVAGLHDARILPHSVAEVLGEQLIHSSFRPR